MLPDHITTARTGPQGLFFSADDLSVKTFAGRGKNLDGQRIGGLVRPHQAQLRRVEFGEGR